MIVMVGITVILLGLCAIVCGTVLQFQRMEIEAERNKEEAKLLR